MMFRHRCGEGALLYHSLVVAVDCCIMSMVIMEENEKEEEQNRSERSVVLLPLCHRHFVHMMTVMRNEWVQMA